MVISFKYSLALIFFKLFVFPNRCSSRNWSSSQYWSSYVLPKISSFSLLRSLLLHFFTTTYEVCKTVNLSRSKHYSLIFRHFFQVVHIPLTKLRTKWNFFSTFDSSTSLFPSSLFSSTKPSINSLIWEIKIIYQLRNAPSTEISRTSPSEDFNLITCSDIFKMFVLWLQQSNWEVSTLNWHKIMKLIKPLPLWNEKIYYFVLLKCFQPEAFLSFSFKAFDDHKHSFKKNLV